MLTWRLVSRTLLQHPGRSVVLACGFGFGVAVMVMLLGVGEVVLEQARAPALHGGGDLLLAGGSGPIQSGRFVLGAVLGGPALAPRVRAAAPSVRAGLFLLQAGGVTPVRARGGVPSLDRGLRDPETAAVASWQDNPADRTWAAPDPAAVLRAMDRFHAIPDAPAHAGSWAEWLYFNGRSADDSVRFYLTFLAGPKVADGQRHGWVRLQLDRGGAIGEARRGSVVPRAGPAAFGSTAAIHVTSYAAVQALPEVPLLEHAPDLAIGSSSVRLAGLRYHLVLDLPAESGGPAVSGELWLDGVPGRSVPPFALRGSGGWISGYTVPVLAGPIGGWLRIGSEHVVLDGGSGYHDHNWGFWRGVTWEWGQVAHEGFEFLYGRVHPPPDAAEQVPGFLAVVGPDGPLGFAQDVSIEREGGGSGAPRAIHVRGEGAGVSLRLELAIEQALATPMRGAADPLEFLQMRALYHVTGRAGGRRLDFTAPGSAETFRRR